VFKKRGSPNQKQEKIPKTFNPSLRGGKDEDSMIKKKGQSTGNHVFEAEKGHTYFFSKKP